MLRDYLPRRDDLPDQFEPDQNDLICFPCAACKHIERPESECKGCAHYYN